MTALVFAAPDSNNPRRSWNSCEGVWAVNVDSPVGIQPLVLNFIPARWLLARLNVSRSQGYSF